MTDYQVAEARVDKTPELEPYRDTILLYEWAEEDHYEWVANAPVTEILSWAQQIRKQEA